MPTPPMYHRKSEFIVPHIAGKSVLDLGCVDHTPDRIDHPEWLHGIVCRHAQSVLGVDILEDEIQLLRQRGYDVVLADVETMDLGRTFDVVLAGDIIEHLSNVGQFLNTVDRHLKADGVCLLTTPVTVNLLRLLELFFKGYVYAHPQHTCWFTPNVLDELIGRHGFKMIETVYVNDADLYYPMFSWWFLPRLVDAACCRLNPKLCETFCAVLKKNEAA